MELFDEACVCWDVEQLYQDLAGIKGKSLTKIEKIHLRGLLCGLSPCEIAHQRQRECGSIEVDISNTIYRYVKILTQHDKIHNWQDIMTWLQENGYRKNTSVSLNIPLPIDNLKMSLLITNNSVEYPPPPPETYLEIHLCIKFPFKIHK